ncbi:hypothetical protein [Rhodococcus koreensis]|jgi:hypothetical protein|uniref:hypothetical protein n=1 Tax=Rhodococcus koreensis TaxID=99653 RepID=UPI00197CD04A|nr:hypothetical protein [Rhodococcus koreensis]QSE84865.1 hypothetical protein JWS14_40155 [Rhodococcus koreensis]
MSATQSRDEQRLVGSFCAVLIGLAAFTCVGAALELASLRHWNEFDQFIPWFVLAPVAVGIVGLPDLATEPRGHAAVRRG